MTDKVREFIDITVGLGQLCESMSEEELRDDERLSTYTNKIRRYCADFTDEERHYVESVVAGVSAAIKMVNSVNESGLGGIISNLTKVLAKSCDCDNCDKAGSCDDEVTVRQLKAEMADG